jgi:alpha-amylase/alpha-mannosidase (GH57 family)
MTDKMKRYICIHGHFYQPPRENPWLEEIEAQDSAYPYHDWNERITAECYEPNGAARILDGNGLITRLVNNYEKVSFNFGPTLLAWMEDKAPRVYETVLAADGESQRRFSGHGSALAQAYNHIIMPLATRRDKETQVVWGIADFEHRFGRKPEGMWLPETAVDLETLNMMAEHGIRFTVLAPSQARRTRGPGSRWKDASGSRIDPTRPYSIELPSGRSMSLFFYDGPISRAVAFEDLLARGEHLAHRLVDAFSDSRTWPQLVHIATDGETYGHHQQFGDMALAYALQYIEENDLATLTNYGEYLEKHPPDQLAEIFEASSWSCAHGVERWRSDCGCHTGGQAGWNQAWRAPLREAFDWLRDETAARYEQKCSEYLMDPWGARNDYIHVVLDRSRENVEDFFGKHSRCDLGRADKTTVLKLLELQRQAMLMYTSCGWFFSEISGIETVQVIRYAGRALQLARSLFGESLENRFLALLEKAKSNQPEYRDGRRIYEELVRPNVVNLDDVGAHYGVSSLFEPYSDEMRLFCYYVERQDSHTFEAGRSKLVVGRAKFTCDITWDSADVSYGALHFGGHNVNGGVRKYLGEEPYQKLLRDIATPFEQGDFPTVIRLLDRHFGESTYSLRSIFHDQKRKILNQILESALSEAEAVYRQLHEHHAPTMRFLTDLGVPSPKAFLTAAEFALNSNLRDIFEGDELDVGHVANLLRSAQAEGVTLDTETLSFAWRSGIEKMAGQFFSNSGDITLLKRLDAAAGLVVAAPFDVAIWKVQNRYYRLLKSLFSEQQEKADQGDEQAQNWVENFVSLGQKLSVRVP